MMLLEVKSGLEDLLPLTSGPHEMNPDATSSTLSSCHPPSSLRLHPCVRSQPTSLPTPAELPELPLKLASTPTEVYYYGRTG